MICLFNTFFMPIITILKSHESMINVLLSKRIKWLDKNKDNVEIDPKIVKFSKILSSVSFGKQYNSSNKKYKLFNSLLSIIKGEDFDIVKYCNQVNVVPGTLLKSNEQFIIICKIGEFILNGYSRYFDISEYIPASEQEIRDYVMELNDSNDFMCVAKFLDGKS